MHHIIILITVIIIQINNNEKYSKDFCNILNSNIIVTNENLNKTYSQVKVNIVIIVLYIFLV